MEVNTEEGKWVQKPKKKKSGEIRLLIYLKKQKTIMHIIQCTHTHTHAHNFNNISYLC